MKHTKTFLLIVSILSLLIITIAAEPVAQPEPQNWNTPNDEVGAKDEQPKCDMQPRSARFVVSSLVAARASMWSFVMPLTFLEYFTLDLFLSWMHYKLLVYYVVLGTAYTHWLYLFKTVTARGTASNYVVSWNIFFPSTYYNFFLASY